jgi:F-type H+-transporting ATPase subunit epsilon
MVATRFELVTPNQTLYSGEAEMIVCRTVDGEIAFLANHMPYIGALDTCLLRIVGPGSGGEATNEPDVRVAVRGGFVEVKDNQVIMLADMAELGTDVDADQARRDQESATERAASGGEEADSAADADRRWAEVRLEAGETP